ncbi:MAG: aminopeptidase [Pseudomonadales bacterium]|jgi:aminopeptidase|nr:aminopeptidase [Pseudomonadales bacterium]
MRDQRLTQLAKILVGECVAIKPGQKVQIKTSSSLGMPLVEACYIEALSLGAHPSYQMGNERLMRHFLKHANDDQINLPPTVSEFEAKYYDAHITIVADENVSNLKNIDSEKLIVRSKLNKKFKDIIFEKPWVLTYYPTPATAQVAQMSLTELEDFYFNTVLTNWSALGKKMQKIANLLRDSELKIEGEKTNLTLSTKGRKWIDDDWKCNMPGGEVFTSPLVESVGGEIYFNYPLTHQGTTMKNIHLQFERGEVVKATASENEAYLQKLIETDVGAKRVGEIAFGVNEGCCQCMNNVLFDEKMAGTIHLALGAGFDETGENVNDSALHLDIIKCMRGKKSKVYDGKKLIYQDGQFIL